MGDYYYKTKHKAAFKANGISIAFVFRCVKKENISPFDSSHTWQWNDDENEKLKNSLLKKLNCPTAKLLEETNRRAELLKNSDIIKNIAKRIHYTIAHSTFSN